MKYIILVILLSFLTVWPAQAKIMRTTSYCPQESGGYYAFNGEKLHEGDCAADPRVFKFGSYLLVDGRKYHFIDVGSAVKGHHIDIFCSNRREMNERGTVMADVEVMGSNEPKAIKKPHKVVSVAKKTLPMKFGQPESHSFVYSSKRAHISSPFRKEDVLLCMD